MALGSELELPKTPNCWIPETPSCLRKPLVALYNFFSLGLCLFHILDAHTHSYVYNMYNLSEMISTCCFSTSKSEAGWLWVHGQFELHSKLQTRLGCTVRPCFRAAIATITTNGNIFSLLPSAFLLSFFIATLTHARKCAMVYSNGRRLA